VWEITVNAARRRRVGPATKRVGQGAVSVADVELAAAVVTMYQRRSGFVLQEVEIVF
jgi:hypothetical protein